MDKYVIKKPRLSTDAPETASSQDPHTVSVSPLDSDVNTQFAAGKSTGASSADVAGDGPSQPSEKLTIGGSHEKNEPSSSKGSGGRGYLKSWESTYGWLSYNAEIGKVYCAICVTARDKKIPLPCTSRDKDSYAAFVERGFENWKKALQRFRSHEKSALHREASTALRTASTGANVATALSESKLSQMKQSRQALLAVLSSVRFLACQGLSLRGHDEDEGNLRQLLMLREADVPGLGAWLNKSRCKWISPDLQNEMLELITHSMLRSLIREVQDALFYAVIADETSDISTQEQISFCLRYVKEGLEVEEVFIGFYVTADTRASTLFSILKDVLCRLNLQIENCRRQCYDGAANVSGKSGGLQALVQDIEPRAMYVHCLAHTLNLVLQDLCKQIDVCRDFVSLFADLVNFVKTSPKRLSWFEQFQKEGTPALRQFCKTRWTLKASSLRSVSSNYSELVQFLFALSSDEKNDTGAKASGYAKALGKFDSYFMLRLMILVFERLESANSALQKKS
ncbi:zinc finger MYM-type protein 1-like [Ornithodoros turicata]|uniref:zinc finger MYM-type protein 1-like n=1 Tax=Ornithodoros turicata TaxID=34597 RepID=UPI0031389938